MCTAISMRAGDHYFGRTLDVERSYGEKVVITPRQYAFPIPGGKPIFNRYALMGMACCVQEVPLYFEAANERGLAMAGLNFPKNAVYLDPVEGKDNIPVFAFIPWILGNAKSVSEAKKMLEHANLVKTPFAEQMPPAPLHFMISDSEASVVVEPTAEGLKLYDNPFDVMTNNPPFDYHLWNMQNYLNLSPENGKNRFSDRFDLQPYAVGMGAMGLPGDTSSASRFVRAAFHLANTTSDGTEAGSVNRFFHLLSSVSMPKGSTYTDSGEEDFTQYTCCINASRGIYYYTTYDNSQITAIYADRADLNSDRLFVYDLTTGIHLLEGN